MQRLEVSGAVRPLYLSLGVKRLKVKVNQSRYRSGQAQRVPEKFRLPDFVTTAQDGGKVVSLTYRPPLLPENTPGTHFC